VSAIFVTATGTDIGKTYVTAGLVRALRAQGHRATALKPVVSGFDMTMADTSDPGVLLQAMGRPVTAQAVAEMSPWRFRAPLSPDMAAARENRQIDFAELVAFCRSAIDTAQDSLLIEGVGGAMVPLDTHHTVLDWIAALDIPAILVAGTYLGTISHTLTALNTLASRSIVVRAAVLNESENAPVPTAEVAETIANFVSPIPMITMPRASHTSPQNGAFRHLCKCIK
jgi:dethiobiotin synthetase